MITRSGLLSLLTILCLMLAVAPAMAQYPLWDNGPYNGTNNAWPINYGYAVSNSFNNVLFQLDIQGIQFVYWDISTTDVLTTVDMGIGGSPFSGGNFFGTLTGVVNTDLGSNQYGYELFQAGFPVPDAFWGDYYNDGWVTLQNACTTSGCSTNPIYWDENSGIGCQAPWGNCPSLAYVSDGGQIPSEAFTLTGYYIEGAGTPEPSSILLFGSGVLGIVGVLRRKLGR